MATAFTRQLGAQSGVQLNPLRDDSEIPVQDNADQIFAIAMRSPRGRIDKPFKVNRGNVRQKLGKGEQIRVSALNEAWAVTVEALNRGAYEAVIQRLVTSAAEIKTLLITENGNSFTHAVISQAEFDALTTPYLLAIKHLECFNDGIQVNFRADEKREGGVNVDNSVVNIVIKDADNVTLYDFTGSLKHDATDDYGNSYFIGDVISKVTDAIEVSVGGVDAIKTTSSAYGYSATTGKANWSKSGVQICFTEGGSAYSVADYMGARQKLQYTVHNYAYISSGGTQSAGLLAQLAQLAFDTNRQLRFDIPSQLTPDEAVTWVEQLNMGASETAHLMQAFWAPFKSDDYTGVNGKGYLGTATLNIAKACLRNAQTNAFGFAPKNYPIAGKSHAIQRTGITQTYTPSEQELDMLARAKINPVIYEIYSGGGRFVYYDQLTCALVESSLKKLISVADMSTSIDDAVTKFAKDSLQLPMKIAVKRTEDFLKKLFENAQASDWLVPSADLGGASFRYDVRPNAVRPYDRMDVSYWLRFDGAVRQIYVTQTLSRP